MYIDWQYPHRANDIPKGVLSELCILADSDSPLGMGSINIAESGISFNIIDKSGKVVCALENGQRGSACELVCAEGYIARCVLGHCDYDFSASYTSHTQAPISPFYIHKLYRRVRALPSVTLNGDTYDITDDVVIVTDDKLNITYDPEAETANLALTTIGRSSISDGKVVSLPRFPLKSINSIPPNADGSISIKISHPSETVTVVSDEHTAYVGNDTIPLDTNPMTDILKAGMVNAVRTRPLDILFDDDDSLTYNKLIETSEICIDERFDVSEVLDGGADK